MRKFLCILIISLIVIFIGGAWPLGAITVLDLNLPDIPKLNLEDPPVAPTRLTLIKLDDYIKLAWEDNSSNESGFKIEHKRGNNDFEEMIKVAANQTTLEIVYAYGDYTDYTYRVCAYNSRGDSSFTNEVSYLMPEELPAPSDLIATRSSNTIRLNWKDNSSNEAYFLIQGYTSSGVNLPDRGIHANTTSYDVVGLELGKTYTFTVSAVNSYGGTSKSNEATVAFFPVVEPVMPGPFDFSPAAPENLDAVALSASEISLSWDDASNNESGFWIERHQQGGNYVQIAEAAANTTTYIDSGLAPNTVYYYKIKANNALGTSGYSNEATAITEEEAAAPLSPANPETPGGGNAIPEEPVSEQEKVILRFYLQQVEYYIKGTDETISQIQSMDTAPVSREGRTLLPVKYVAQPLGATVNWDAAEQKVTVTLGAKHIELWIGRNIASVDGVEKVIDPVNPSVVPLILPPGRTMLPLRFITENLGCDVDWEPVTQEVKISYPRE